MAGILKSYLNFLQMSPPQSMEYKEDGDEKGCVNVIMGENEMLSNDRLRTPDSWWLDLE
jgi:hypothetical protein